MSDPTPERGAERRGGLMLEGADRPRVSALGVAASLGAVWGLLGYAVLWEGEPFSVQRPFVESGVGMLVLLPVRTVIWGIHLAESLADRTFELSSNHWWIGALAGLTGAVLAAGAWWLGRAAARRRRPTTPSAHGSW